MMTRRATGYVTNTGQFFQTKAEADAYEAVAEYSAAIEALLTDCGYDGPIRDYTREVIRYFVLVHAPAVKAFMAHFKSEVPDKPTLTPKLATGPVALPPDTPIAPEEPRFDLDDTFDQDLADLEVFDPEDTPPPDVPPAPIDEDFSDLTPEQRAAIFGGDSVDYEALHAETLSPELETLGEDDSSRTSKGDNEEI